MPEQECTEDMNDFSEDDRHIERLLASLVPRETRVSRDRVMFLAGQASAIAAQQSQRCGKKTRWIWPALTICSAGAGLLMGVVVAERHSFSGNPLVEAQHGRQVAADISKGVVAARIRNLGSAGTTAAAADSTALQPAAKREEIFEGGLSLSYDNPFGLLALRDRMLAENWDGDALAQVDDSPMRSGPPSEAEQPLGARKLLQRWIAEEGLNPH